MCRSHPTRGFVERPDGASVARGSVGASNNLLIPTRLVLVPVQELAAVVAPSVSVVHFPLALASADTELGFLVPFEAGSDLQAREAPFKVADPGLASTSLRCKKAKRRFVYLGSQPGLSIGDWHSSENVRNQGQGLVARVDHADQIEELSHWERAVMSA